MDLRNDSRRRAATVSENAATNLLKSLPFFRLPPHKVQKDLALCLLAALLCSTVMLNSFTGPDLEVAVPVRRLDYHVADLNPMKDSHGDLDPRLTHGP